MADSVALDLIADARSYATNTVSQAISQLGGAMTALQGLNDAGTTPNLSIQVRPPTPVAVDAVPTYTGPRYAAETFPGTRPTLTTVPAFQAPASPGVAPTLATYDDPTLPEGTVSTELLQGVPEMIDIEIDDAPDLISEIRGLQAPALLSVTMPADVSFVEPSFDGNRPDAPPSPPTDLEATMRAEFMQSSEMMRTAATSYTDAFIDREFPAFRTGMAAIEERLATYLAGGTGLAPDVEDAIYSRALDKNNVEAVRARETAMNSATRAGWEIPPIALYAVLRDVDQKRRDNNSRAAVDIAIQQAELEQKNLQFAVTASTQLRSIAINAAMAYMSNLVQINGQALQYAREVVDAIVKAYDLAVRYAEVQARAYEADARVYEARLRGATARIDAYVAKIKGLEAQANVNAAQVNAYKARLEAVQAEAVVYRAIVDGAVAKAGIERAKVELYSARVGGYVAQVNGLTARYQGYNAAVQGQTAKMQASAEQIRGYTATIAAYESQVRAASVVVESAAKTNELLLKGYEVDVQAWAAKIRGQAESIHTEAELFDSQLRAFVAKAQAGAEYSKAEISLYETGLRAVVEQAHLYLNSLSETHKLKVARAQGIASVATSAAGVYSAQAQASISGMNTLAAEVVQASA